VKLTGVFGVRGWCMPYYFSLDDVFLVGRDSSVGIASCYGLEGKGIISWRGGGGRGFSHPSRPGCS
jgi:hypothetical protein